MDEVGLGKQLQEARIKAGLTQQTLCQKADISYSTLAKIERGAIKAPSIFTIQRIASVLGLTLNELLGISESQGSGFPPIVPKKVSKSGVRFVYFDVNGCLVQFFHRALERISEEYDLSPDVVEMAFWQHNDMVCRGEISIDEFNKRFANDLNLDNIDWAKYYIEEVEPVQGMDDLLSWAIENYHVGLMTNIMPGFLNELIDHNLVPNINYDVIIDSSEVGAIKPEEAIYEEAEDRSNCQPSEILLIDDSRPNLMTASKKGWKVLWFNSNNPEQSISRIKNALEFVD